MAEAQPSPLEHFAATAQTVMRRAAIGRIGCPNWRKCYEAKLFTPVMAINAQPLEKVKLAPCTILDRHRPLLAQSGARNPRFRSALPELRCRLAKYQR
jgi:Protein of unknown function (DUF2826)